MLLAYLFCDIYIPTLSDNYDTFYKQFVLVVILRRHNLKILGRPNRRLGSGWLNSIWSDQPRSSFLWICWERIQDNSKKLKKLFPVKTGLNIHLRFIFDKKINPSISPKNNCTIGYILINFLLLKILIFILDQRQNNSLHSRLWSFC